MCPIWYLPEHVCQIWLRSDGRVGKKGGTDRQTKKTAALYSRLKQNIWYCSFLVLWNWSIDVFLLFKRSELIVVTLCFSRCWQHTERDAATGVWRDTTGSTSGQDLPSETDNLCCKDVTTLGCCVTCEHVFASNQKDIVHRRPRRSAP